MDYSTINLDILRSLPVYHTPTLLRLQDGSGNGCVGDAPGYPSYFTRNIYTRHGSEPYLGPLQVITDPDDDTTHYVVLEAGQEDRYTKRAQMLQQLWRPLPLDHERTRLWIVSQYQHFRHCYQDVEQPEYGRPGTIIFPVPSWKLKVPHFDPHWTEEHKRTVQAEADAFNNMLRKRSARIATPDNHWAVVAIRRFYPDYQPEHGLIHDTPMEPVGHWWETEARQPSEEDCAHSQRWGNKHPVNTTWCQWCGRTYSR